MDGASDGSNQGEHPVGAPEAEPEGEGPEAREKATTGTRTAESRDAARKWRREPGLALSFRKGLPVEGTVEKVIRGGYEVRVGKARGFCPHSQMDLRHVEQPEQHVGHTYQFKPMQLRRGGEEVILSRRALLDEERVEEAKAVRATLVEGSIMQGHVARLTDFGVFVDLGAGVTGLVHVSEVARGRVAKLEDFLKPGDVVQVRVVKLDDSNGRISLSMKQAEEDPWKTVPARYRAGEIHPGILRRLADFGAFVEMSPGVEALAPQDGFPPLAGGWQEGLEPGQTRDWRVISVDPERKRMSVQPSFGADAYPLPETLAPGAKLKGRVQRVEKFGVFVWLAPGRVGLVPATHTGTRKGTDLGRAFAQGTEIEVEVVEADPESGRVRLAVPGAVPQPAPRREGPPSRERERADRPAAAQGQRSQRAEPPPAPGSAFGTSLGDALRRAIDKKNADGG